MLRISLASRTSLTIIEADVAAIFGARCMVVVIIKDVGILVVAVDEVSKQC